MSQSNNGDYGWQNWLVDIMRLDDLKMLLMRRLKCFNKLVFFESGETRFADTWNHSLAGESLMGIFAMLRKLYRHRHLA